MSQLHSETVIRQFNQGRDASYLSPEEEVSLFLRYKDHNDQKAYDKLFRSHMRLVHKMAGKYARQYKVMQEDLNQEGYVGLMKGIEKFEPEKGFRLNTYAGWWIRSSLQDYILRNTNLVRIGTTAEQKRLFFNLNRVTNDVIAKEPHIADSEFLVDARVADKLGTDIETVQAMRLRMQGVSSLDAPLNGDAEDSSTLQEVLADENNLNPEESALKSSEDDYRKDLLRRAFEGAGLNSRETQILTARRLKETPTTLEELSDIFGVSRERVRQIEVKAMEKLGVAARVLCGTDDKTVRQRRERHIRKLRPTKIVA